MNFTKTHGYILKAVIAVSFIFLRAGTSAADEADRFEALCMEFGMASFDAGPLMTIKLHGAPGFMRGQEKEQPSVIPPKDAQTPPDPPAPDSPSKPAENMMIVVSGDEIVLKGVAASPVPAVVSRDIIIPRPDAVRPEPAPKSPAGAAAPGQMIWPVSGGVSSGYGRRGIGTHTGLDMPMPPDTPIVAAMDGVVLLTATSRDARYRGYGNTVVIDHGNGLTTMYAHCSKFNVSKDQYVRQGDVVAFVGRTGRATTNHVHFEVRKNGAPVNPIPYLVPR